MSRNRDNNSTPEMQATPLVAAHVDEELLTRKKYFEQKLKEQTEQLESERQEKERKLFEKRAADEADAKAIYRRNTDRLDRDLSEQRERDERRRIDEESSAVKRISMQREKREKEETETLQWITSQQDGRKYADWALRHPQEAAREDENEALAHAQLIQTMEDSAAQELALAAKNHQRRMEKITEDAFAKAEMWLRMKPVLIGAMLGGAFGLWITPNPSSNL